MKLNCSCDVRAGSVTPGTGAIVRAPAVTDSRIAGAVWPRLADLVRIDDGDAGAGREPQAVVGRHDGGAAALGHRNAGGAVGGVEQAIADPVAGRGQRARDFRPSRSGRCRSRTRPTARRRDPRRSTARASGRPCAAVTVRTRSPSSTAQALVAAEPQRAAGIGRDGGDVADPDVAAANVPSGRRTPRRPFCPPSHRLPFAIVRERHDVAPELLGDLRQRQHLAVVRHLRDR